MSQFPCQWLAIYNIFFEVCLLQKKNKEMRVWFRSSEWHNYQEIVTGLIEPACLQYLNDVWKIKSPFFPYDLFKYSFFLRKLWLRQFFLMIAKSIEVYKYYVCLNFPVNGQQSIVFSLHIYWSSVPYNETLLVWLQGNNSWEAKYIQVRWYLLILFNPAASRLLRKKLALGCSLDWW